jgi:two-component system nitrate/nitrite response regulator NarL
MTMSSATEERATKVLVVDDESDIRLLVRMQLQAEGYEVVGDCPDGAAAVEQVRAHHPDAVILDLLMPGMTGFEAIPLIRELDDRIAIIAYTAVAGDFVRRAMAREKVTLVLKSGNVGPLIAAIEAARAAVAR